MTGGAGEELQGFSHERHHLRFATEEMVVLQISTRKDGSVPSSRIVYQWVWFYTGRQDVEPLLLGCARTRETDLEAIRKLFESFTKGIREIILTEEDDFKRKIEAIGERIRVYCIPPEIVEELKKLRNDVPTQVLIITDDSSIPWELAVAGINAKNMSVGTLFIREHGPFEPKVDFSDPKILLILPPIQPKETKETAAQVHGSENNANKLKRMFSEAFRIPKDKTDSIIIFDESNISKDDVLFSLIKGNFDFIYFLGHGIDRSEDKQRFCLKIKDNEYITLEDIQEATLRKKSQIPKSTKTPIVFLNACESVSGGYSVIADAFLDFGACAVIGTFWRILTEPAIQFSKLFFEELSEKKFATVGDALRIAKQHMCDKPMPFSEYATYSLRGVPGAILTIKTAEEGVICLDRFLKYSLYQLFVEDPAIMPRGISVKIIEPKSEIMSETTKDNIANLLKYLESEIPTILCVPLVTVAHLVNIAEEIKSSVNLAIVGVLFEPEAKTIRFIARKDEAGCRLRDILGYRTSVERALKIGISGTHMVPSLLARYVLMNELGDDYRTGKSGAVRFIDLPQMALPSALEQRIVDLIVMYWPFVFELNESEYKFLEIDPIDLYEEEGGHVIGQLVVTDRRHLEKSKETIEKMIGLLEVTRDWSIDNAQELAKIYHNEKGISEDAAKLSLRKVRRRAIAIQNDHRKTSIAKTVSKFWKEALQIGGLEKIPNVEIANLVFCLPCRAKDEEEIEGHGVDLEELLDNRLSKLYENVSKDKDLNDLLIHIQNAHPNFTSHGPDHSENIIKALETIIPRSTWDKFTPLEILLLLCSAWIHDVGMADFEGKLAECSNESERRKLAKDLRDGHYERAEKYITDSKNYRRLSLDSALAGLIGKICKAHNREYDITQLPKKWGPIQGYEKYKQVRVQLLAALLRLADACDLGKQRVKEVLIEVYNIPKNYAESIPHIKGALLISGVVPEGRSIVVQAMPQNEEQEKWVRFLKSDLEADFLSVESVLKDAENGIIIPYDDVIIKKLEIEKSSS